ncbi:Ammonium transporter AmtB-like domain [Pseudocohnilembus persalinus]|uniref:Ammonium transporter AmtB-like domain n=1 Tax=Pseudocohnilembus persalinus TaxID=266149 RepID=A0A0V0R9C3_PSEPJ|nr:Ammonium transporter AmtB-like domain [Pseudocohnilembus persalinus]|eukprot:KRX11101.1 Ammonium transporter AmtB-like domain [Pseudocohnilembus persalinus]
MEQNQNEQEEIEKCFQCDIRNTDPKIASDLGVCRECYNETNEFLEQLLEERIRENKLNPEISEILPGKLYLGNQHASVSKDILKNNKITHILAAGACLSQKFPDEFQYLGIDINDATVQDISKYLDQCIDFIEQGNTVFVHCHQGISRSSSIVIAYIMKKNCWTFQQAFDFVKERRKEICPNSGFGFIKVFLRNHSFTSVAYNLLVGVWSIQLTLVFQGMWSNAFGENTTSDIEFTYKNFGMANYSAASILIAFGACAGKLNSFQLVIMAIFGTFFWSLNYAIAFYALEISDAGGSVLIHLFGACFGLGVAKAINRANWDLQETQNKIKKYSVLYSLMGTLFLFTYFPSFNGLMALQYGYVAQQQAYFNTMLSLLGAVIMAFLASSFLNKGKFVMEDVINSSLAGGAIIGTGGPICEEPYAAIIVGNVAGLLCVIGTKYIPDFLNKKLKAHDSCNTFNSHLIPGFLGGFIGIIFIKAYETGFQRVFGALSSVGYVAYGDREDKIKDQVAYIFITLGIALVSGYFVGLILRIQVIFQGPTKKEDLFADQYHFKTYQLTQEGSESQMIISKDENQSDKLDPNAIVKKQLVSQQDFKHFINRQCEIYLSQHEVLAEDMIGIQVPAEQKQAKTSMDI